jgi:hypothetical protein
MPLLYGEGCHVSRRLQEEIFSMSEDASIFARRPTGRAQIPEMADLDPTSSVVLTDGPDHFYCCGDTDEGNLESSMPWAVTSRGLQLYARARSLAKGPTPHVEEFMLDLKCNGSTPV